MRHTAMVPKGFLRYYVLKLLNEKPMSGSEIMNKIEEQTNSHWRPSPGSIYPLIAWLQDRGYIKEAPTQEAGTKRYTLTDQGKAFLEEHLKIREEMRERFRHFGQMFMGPIWLELYPERALELRRATKQLAVAVLNLHESLRQKYSEEAATRAKETLEEAAEKIGGITKKLKEQG